MAPTRKIASKPLALPIKNAQPQPNGINTNQTRGGFGDPLQGKPNVPNPRGIMNPPQVGGQAPNAPKPMYPGSGGIMAAVPDANQPQHPYTLPWGSPGSEVTSAGDGHAPGAQPQNPFGLPAPTVPNDIVKPPRNVLPTNGATIGGVMGVAGANQPQTGIGGVGRPGQGDFGPGAMGLQPGFDPANAPQMDPNYNPHPNDAPGSQPAKPPVYGLPTPGNQSPPFVDVNDPNAPRPGVFGQPKPTGKLPPRVQGAIDAGRTGQWRGSNQPRFNQQDQLATPSGMVPTPEQANAMGGNADQSLNPWNPQQSAPQPGNNGMKRQRIKQILGQNQGALQGPSPYLGAMLGR